MLFSFSIPHSRAVLLQSNKRKSAAFEDDKQEASALAAWRISSAFEDDKQEASALVALRISSAFEEESKKCQPNFPRLLFQYNLFFHELSGYKNRMN